MLKGRIDKNLEVYVTLTVEDVEALERERSIKGIMEKPVVQPQSQEDAGDERLYDKNSIVISGRKCKKTSGSGLKPNKCVFTAYLRGMFRFEGLPSNAVYWNRRTYDIHLSLGDLQQLRKGRSIVKKEPAVPVNYICVSLENAARSLAENNPSSPSQTQSL
ncbi:MAG: hypothetical protein QXT19_01470 [Candidatus Woesearchaeota archaeon]